MITVQVTFTIKRAEIKKFIDITKYNVTNSRDEKGVIFFDFYKISGSDNAFMLFESYKSKEDQELHRNSIHYKEWKKVVENLLEKPYEIKYLESIE